MGRIGHTQGVNKASNPPINPAKKMYIHISLSRSTNSVKSPCLSVPNSPTKSSCCHLISFVRVSKQTSLPVLYTNKIPLLHSTTVSYTHLDVYKRQTATTATESATTAALIGNDTAVQDYWTPVIQELNAFGETTSQQDRSWKMCIRDRTDTL